MKRVIYNAENIMAMANVNKKRTGLNVNIWSDGQGCLRNKSDIILRVKLVAGEDSISVSLDAEPKVLAPENWKSKFKKSVVDDFLAGIKYVKDNRDVFLAHYLDTDLSFDDEDLFNELRARGCYK